MPLDTLLFGRASIHVATLFLHHNLPQVYLQDRDQRAVASLLVKYLSQDIAQLQSKLDAPQCSGRTASMVLIQDTNRIIVENLIAVRTVVETAARGGRWTTIEKLAEDGWAK